MSYYGGKEKVFASDDEIESMGMTVGEESDVLGEICAVEEGLELF